MSSQTQLNNLPTGYAAVDFAMTAIQKIVPWEKGADDALSKEARQAKHKHRSDNTVKMSVGTLSCVQVKTAESEEGL